ncbi:hypothetical protein M3J09_010599 [Ascochyta lentis]
MTARSVSQMQQKPRRAKRTSPTPLISPLSVADLSDPSPLPFRSRKTQKTSITYQTLVICPFPVLKGTKGRDSALFSRCVAECERGAPLCRQSRQNRCVR